MHGQEETILVPAYQLSEGDIVEPSMGLRARVKHVAWDEDTGTTEYWAEKFGTGDSFGPVQLDYEDRVKVVEVDV
jgi:hypothetical protein